MRCRRRSAVHSSASKNFELLAGSPRIAFGDRRTPLADLVFGERLAVLEDPVDAKAARIVPATKPERLIRNGD